MQSTPQIQDTRTLSGGFTPQAPHDDIRDTLQTEQLPVPEFPQEEFLLGLLVLVAIVLAVMFVRRRRRPKTPEPLEHAARRRLAELSAHTAPDARAFHAELAAILLRYVEAKVGVPSSHLTSREIVRAFRRNGRMSEDWRERLEQLLAECDRAKFAPAFDADWEPSATLERARAVLDHLAAQAASAPRLADPWKGWSDAAV